MSAQQTPATPTRPAPANTAAVARAIASYAPVCLPGRRWAQCANAARAAVAATHPATGKVARLRLTHLCQFLSTPCGWAGVGAPALATLLTESTIAAFVYKVSGMENTASTDTARRTNLRSRTTTNETRTETKGAAAPDV
jgi:hypothetical protein